MRVPEPSRDYTLRSPRLQLERAGPTHVDYLLSTLADGDFWRHYRANQPRRLSREQLYSGLEKEALASPEKLRKIEWVVINRSGATPRPIGLACLADFVPAGKKAELLVGIRLPADRAHGTALEAGLLVMEFAFNVARLNKLISYVYGDNQPAQHNTLALGFQQEGLLREHIYDRPHDRYLDVYQNGLLVGEFRSSQRLARLSTRLLKRDVTRPPPPSPGRNRGGWTINTSLDY